MKLGDTLKDEPARILTYGVSGSGKTTLAGLMAMYEEFSPLYIFDWDLRIGTLRARLDKKFWDNVISDPYRDVRMQGEAFTLMQAKAEKLEGEGIRTVVIDSGTFCMTGIMHRVLMLDGKPPTQTPQLQHYMQQQSLFKDIIGRLCSKKMNVVLNCHEDTNKDEMTGRLFKAVDLTGKLSNQIPGYFNEIWHSEINQISGQEPKYVIRTKSDMVYPARTSFRSLSVLEQQESIWQKVIAEKKILQAPPTAPIAEPQKVTVGAA
jgi:hypothetical protein